MNPRRKNDILLKSIIEEFFTDMLRFFFADAGTVFNLNRDIEFMDKELLEIMPDTKATGGSRYMDMLAKVWLQNGGAEWILVHVEIQAQNDPQFARRMFTYYYRALDKFNVPITAFAIFTGSKFQQKPALFERSFMGTRLLYEYNTYHILNHTQAELLQMDNPFALVILAAQKVLLSGKVPEEELNRQRLTIAKALIESKRYNHEEVKRFLSFLKNFIYVGNKEINDIFDKQISFLTGKIITMDIFEAVNLINREEGRKEGREEGITAKTEKVVVNLIMELGLNDDQVARIAETSSENVRKIREKLNR